MKTIILGLALLAITTGCVSVPKYGMKTTSDKLTDFTKLKTYASTTGWLSYYPEIDRQIMQAVDRELAALGFTKVPASEPCDALATYASILRRDVDVHSKQSPETRLRREYPVATLVIMLLEPQHRSELFKVKADIPLALEPGKLAPQIDASVAQMFSKYPTRKSGHQP